MTKNDFRANRIEKHNDIRDSVIDGLYEAVLYPERYDDLMESWAEYLGDQVDGLEHTSDVEKRMSQVNDDPVLKTHFERALLMLERMEPASQSKTDSPNQPQILPEANYDLVLQDGQITYASPEIAASLKTQSSNNQPVSLDSLLDSFEYESAQRLSWALKGMQTEPQTGLLTIVTFAEPVANLQHLAVLGCVWREQPAVALRRLSVNWTTAIEQALTDAFEFSAAEVEVARDMALGFSLAEIAGERSRSLHTVRAQYKAVLRKTTVSSQAGFAKLIAVLSMVPNRAANVAKSDSGFANAIVKALDRTIVLSDGSKMDVEFQGPVEGQPVIFIHGMLDGTAVTRQIDTLLKTHKIRLICPIRPGFGRTKHQPDHANAVQKFSSDLVELADQLNIERTVLIGHMSGAVFACAGALALGKRAVGIINVSGGVPILSPRQFRKMAPRQRLVAYTARFAPSLLPPILRAGIAQIRAHDATAFMHALYQPDTYDRKIVEELGLAPVIQDGYRFATFQGYHGFQSDSWHVVRNWSYLYDQLNQAKMPVTLLHGTYDPVVAIETVRDLAARNPHVTLLEQTDSGQLIFYQKPDVVLSHVDKLCAQITC